MGDFFGLAINQIAQFGLSSLPVIYYLEQLFRRAFEVPRNICSESASGGAAQINSSSAAITSSYRLGGGAYIKNSIIKNVIDKPSASTASDASMTAKVSAMFCDPIDYSAYGGTSACLKINNEMPAADKRFDSLTSGAGKNNKEPDLTFSQEQTDVARMYTKNTIRRSIGKKLSKNEVNSSAGHQYIGLTTQLESILSAASEPQERALANKQPLDVTKELIEEVLQTPSAQAYFQMTASKEAKRTGKMSQAEFETFEAGRRYSNTDYQRDLQEMSGDNLLREQIRIASFQNWLLLGIKNEMATSNIIQGQQLASMARIEFEPILASKYQSVSAKSGT
ncbi:TraW protein (fragment) [Xenorhabdus nematophila str. Websteri]